LDEKVVYPQLIVHMFIHTKRDFKMKTGLIRWIAVLALMLWDGGGDGHSTNCSPP
jgi:hypothetical protein